jgi:hypothetical protein
MSLSFGTAVVIVVKRVFEMFQAARLDLGLPATAGAVQGLLLSIAFERCITKFRSPDSTGRSIH